MKPESMTQDEWDLRLRIVATGRNWIGTPWHHQARVKGAGVDCANLLIAVYAEVGLIEPFTPEHYPPDWHLHRDDPRFLGQLLQFCVPTTTPQLGDIAMFRFARAAAHGGILVSDDLVLHAWRDEGRVTITELSNAGLADRLAGFYRWSGFA